MKQLTQALMNGDMNILDVPMPLVAPGMVLVRNYFSFISAGTEGDSVERYLGSWMGWYLSIYATK